MLLTNSQPYERSVSLETSMINYQFDTEIEILGTWEIGMKTAVLVFHVHTIVIFFI